MSIYPSKNILGLPNGEQDGYKCKFAHNGSTFRKAGGVLFLYFAAFVPRMALPSLHLDPGLGRASNIKARERIPFAKPGWNTGPQQT